MKRDMVSPCQQQAGAHEERKQCTHKPWGGITTTHQFFSQHVDALQAPASKERVTATSHREHTSNHILVHELVVHTLVDIVQSADVEKNLTRREQISTQGAQGLSRRTWAISSSL